MIIKRQVLEKTLLEPRPCRHWNATLSPLLLLGSLLAQITTYAMQQIYPPPDVLNFVFTRNCRKFLGSGEFIHFMREEKHEFSVNLRYRNASFFAEHFNIMLMVKLAS